MSNNNDNNPLLAMARMSAKDKRTIAIAGIEAYAWYRLGQGLLKLFKLDSTSRAIRHWTKVDMSKIDYDL